MQSRSRLVLPAPFGPTISVGAPGAIVRFNRSRIVVAPASQRDVIENQGKIA